MMVVVSTSSGVRRMNQHLLAFICPLRCGNIGKIPTEIP